MDLRFYSVFGMYMILQRRVNGWNEEYREQLRVLADYKKPVQVNEKVAGYVKSSAKRLIDSYNDPTQAMTDEALQSVIGLLASKIFLNHHLEKHLVSWEQ